MILSFYTYHYLDSKSTLIMELFNLTLSARYTYHPDETQVISLYGLVGGAQKGWQLLTVLLLYARYAAHRSWIPGFRSASRNGSPGCGEPHAVRTPLIFLRCADTP
jgi:hypothetical protein